MQSKKFTLAVMTVIPLALNLAIPAFGDGRSDEEITQTIGDLKATLFIQVSPPVLTVESAKNASIFIKFYDADSNQTIQHVSYFIRVEKEGQLLMQDQFHSHNGELMIKIKPKEGPVIVYGDPDPVLGWTATGGPIAVQAPIFIDGGLYHFSIEIFSMKNDALMFKEGDRPKFESWLSVGDISYNRIEYQQKNYDLSIISYYDKIKDFAFDAQTKRISYAMPFNWDIQRLEKSPIFVHEEIKVPRNFEILSSGMYSGTVNGMEIPDDAILVDDSNPEFYVVHYMLKKEHILNFAKELQTKLDSQPRDAMIFTLYSRETFPLERTTSDGNIKVQLTWNPMKIEPGNKVTFELKFIDAKTGNALNNVNYDFMIIKDGTHLIYKTSQKAIDGSATQEFTFEPLEHGSATIKLENLNNARESVEFSINVVPEFPVNLMAITAIGLIGVLVAVRLKSSAKIRV